ncbi:unnamed protein product [Cylicocyclus nassatus]|uniref:CN hydrolase domain-containing protein n=1 Tax=Cylicocyclus nassatus TaxID=53992 RepID=A0AA36M715_CYLNA|nr:unnamed protein product [Cylicocyclus nassatus]
MTQTINCSEMSIAIAQVGTVIYDTPATLDKLERITNEAANKGAKLIVFREAFIGGYPKGLDFGIVLATRSQRVAMSLQTIEENGPEFRRIAELASTLGINIVTGVVEKQGGTLYCSVG